MDVFFKEIIKDEEEQRKELEETIAVAVRVAFMTKKEDFVAYMNKFQDEKLLARVERLKKSGYKFDGTVKVKK